MEAAHHGTLFLDEVGSLPDALQAKLLTAIESRQVRRIGRTRSESVDVWIIAATSEDLTAAMRAGRFRQELYHRLTTVVLELPPLRARGRDVLELAEHFLARAATEHGIGPKRLADDAREGLLSYAWPGNVRELANVLERVTLLEDSPVITLAMLALPVAPNETFPGARRLPEELSRADERQQLVEALEASRWNISRAAARLGIPRNTLRYRLAKHRLNPRGTQPSADGDRTEARPALEPTGPASTPAKAIRWEERPLAVLGATLAGSPEGGSFDLASMMPELIEKVMSFGARIEQFTPSDLVAVFGIDPVEDAPRRAVLAALAIVRGLGRREDAKHGRFAIHLGSYLIARTGAVTGMDAHARRRATDVVNALLERAELDQLVVDAPAARVLERHFEMKPVSAGPTAVYRVVGRERSGFDVGGRTLSRFVGRSRDLETLRELLARAEAGEAQVVGLVGLAGVGKSRLVDEFRRSVARDRVGFLTARCVGHGGTTPYLPIIELVWSAFGVSETDTLATTADKVGAGLMALGINPDDARPYVLHLLGFGEGTEALAGSAPDAVKMRTLEVLTQIVLAGSRQRSRVVVIEDLQWIDRTSEEALMALAEALASCRLMLLTTYRPDYRPPWLGRSYASQLVVAPLTSGDSQSVVQSVAPHLSSPAAESIVARGEGLPFFLEELARAVEDDGGLRAAPAIPDTIQGVLLARLDRLPEEDRRTIESASVIGKDVPVRVLEAVMDLPADVLRTSLARLQAREFIFQTSAFPVAQYTFRHALTRDVTYESLGGDRRRREHARVAQALEAATPDSRDRMPEILAHHYTLAELPRPAVECWHNAGIRALRRGAHAEALAQLRQGLDLVAALPDAADRMRQELTLQLALGNALVIDRGYGAPEVEGPFGRARALCAAVGDTSEFCPALWGLWRYHVIRAEFVATREVGRQLFSVATHERRPDLLVAGHLALGITAFYQGDLAGARDHLEHAVALCRPEMSSDHIVHYGQELCAAALAYLSWLLALQGDGDEAIDYAQRAIGWARQVAHPYSLVFALQVTASTYLVTHDAAQAGRFGEEIAVLSREHGFPLFLAGGHWLTGYALVAEGATERGLKAMREGALAFHATGSQTGLIYFALLAEVFVDIGRIDDALLIASHGLVRSDETTEHVYRAELLRIHGEARLRQDGDHASEAEQRFLEATALARRQGARVFELRAATSLARLWSGQGRRAAARARLEETLGQDDRRAESADERAAQSLLASLA